MSKTTKIIAALGVVAGLGVAALPAFTYATQTGQEVSGDVDLYVEVQPAIAMTIEGNNDSNTYYGTAASESYDEVTPDGSENPAEEGWYESDGDGGYQETEDTTVDGSKTYYERTTTAGDNATVHVKNPSGASTIDGEDVTDYEVGVATKASSSYVSLLPNSSATMISTITVYTNNASGYTLTVKDADNDPNLVNIADSNAVIEASATPSAGAGAGWSISGGDLLSAIAVTAAEQTVKETAAKTSGGDETVMTYTVATAADQKTGVYTDTITYTATTNN